MRHYRIETAGGCRLWHADSTAHAVEQHRNAFPDEPVADASAVGECLNVDQPELCDRGL